MMTTTGDVIRKILKKDTSMAIQTNGWFFPLGRDTQLFKTPVFPPQMSLFWLFKTPAELFTKDTKG